MSLAKKRCLLYVGLLLFVLAAVATVYDHSLSCDDCCSSGDCSDCQDCHCASTASFVLPTSTSSELYDQLGGEIFLPSQVIPGRDWFSDIDRPPRLFSS